MMRKTTAILLLAAGLLAGACAPKTTHCVNPLTYTDIPDNDVIRVGEDYYMVSTTLFYCPGAPIMHSRDLVHWRIVSYVYDCLADDDVYNLRGGANAYGKGQWATSLRYEDGVFYALFIANDQQKTYVYRTRDIENGPWEGNVIEGVFFHDASLLFDDGHVYAVYGNGDLRITELTPDLRAVKEGGVDRLLISAPREGMSLRAEGAHFYHIGDYYYVLEIDWPRNGVRTETCWRSRSLLGPYESRIILQGAFDGRQDGVAQGAIIDTQYGDWYAVMFQDHGTVGRIPTLQPVTWVDGWPILGDDTVPVKSFEVNLPEWGADRVWASDEFDGGDRLDLVWQWNHKPLDGCWSLSERPGWLRLTTGQLATGVMDARNSLTQRTVGPACTSETLLDASGMLPGDYAGICAFQSYNCSIGVRVAEDGSRVLVAESRSPREGVQEILRLPLSQDCVWLRLRYDFDRDTAFMAYSLDGSVWTELDYSLQMRYTLDLFVGYRSMLFNYATLRTGGHADFDYFRQEII